jgi:hypothetical protein
MRTAAASRGGGVRVGGGSAARPSGGAGGGGAKRVRGSAATTVEDVLVLDEDRAEGATTMTPEDQALWTKAYLKALHAIQKKPFAKFFRERPKIDGYYNVIPREEAVWLNQVEDKLNNGDYEGPEDCEEAMRQLVKNCTRFNALDTPGYKAGQELWKQWQREVKAALQANRKKLKQQGKKQVAGDGIHTTARRTCC